VKPSSLRLPLSNWKSIGINNLTVHFGTFVPIHCATWAHWLINQSANQLNYILLGNLRPQASWSSGQAWRCISLTQLHESTRSSWVLFWVNVHWWEMDCSGCDDKEPLLCHWPPVSEWLFEQSPSLFGWAVFSKEITPGSTPDYTLFYGRVQVIFTICSESLRVPGTWPVMIWPSEESIYLSPPSRYKCGHHSQVTNYLSKDRKYPCLL
jgi:hypothetical protein